MSEFNCPFCKWYTDDVEEAKAHWDEIHLLEYQQEFHDNFGDYYP